MYQASDKRYSSMQYNRCGKSGLMLPAVSLGLWHNFGDTASYENMKQLCFTAFDNGITHFDLANNYGPAPGSAEKNFGSILKDGLGAYRDELLISTKAGYEMWDGHFDLANNYGPAPGSAEKNFGSILKDGLGAYRDELLISTKAGYEMWDGPYGNWGSRKYLLASLDQSLRRMGLDYVDIFYHHRMDPDTPLEETMGALAQAVKSGKALYAGLSNYDGATLEKACTILDSLHCPFVINQNRYSIHCPFVINQNRYSIFDRSIEQNGLKDTAQRLNKGIICFSPLAQGMLTDRYLNGIPQDSRIRTDGRFLQENALTDERLAQIRSLNEIAQQRGQTLAAI